jgi:putative endonuclease
MYILHSTTLDKFYIGSSENIEARLKKHLADHKGFTGKAKDWKVIYFEEFFDKSDALSREMQIKKWKSSNMVRDLIRNN